MKASAESVATCGRLQKAIQFHNLPVSVTSTTCVSDITAIEIIFPCNVGR